MAKSYSTLPVPGFAHGSKNLFPPESLEETRQVIENLCIHIKFASKIRKCEKFTGGNNTAIAFTCLPLNAKDKCQRIACVLPEEKFKIHKLVLIGAEMEQKGLFVDEPAVVWHLDFYPRNIMIESSRNHVMLTGVIDWDDAKAVPRIMARRPPNFLWNMPGNPLLPEEKTAIATIFNREMERLCPGYLQDAYLGSRVMVRALCVYAFSGVDYRFYHEWS
ncbi:predicted protein [Sclerotinia sclerotiorum 1980 UF-70]|uniref:Aminoglycoside phosphotransferase domain-containing protein n=1 Tax=Sclerotinia sclerotiorum (strain ATCC 18683 / 1980 / Ss-1) TaxID=665079 RepID=A7ECM6_SCLS1|nr:predicted protein [Sclerotinia sclerotiorum 1980 UF-70]EDO00205.1 predicted protein [Sclerotinia sclerotiorum 1980 UF-70]